MSATKSTVLARSPESPGARESRASLAGLDALLDGEMGPVRRGDVAGAVVAVVKDGQVLLLKVSPRVTTAFPR
jgi:CubicO group peptidase (beta-lactamase class C family)